MQSGSLYIRQEMHKDALKHGVVRKFLAQTMHMNINIWQTNTNTLLLSLQLKRTHFHDFMLDVHSSLKKYHSHQDPLVQVADSVARESKVLCLDEFFVNDVADAAILNRLFSRLWENGLVLVSTSNRAPDALYENGLQRNLFLPFIEKLKVCCTCVGFHPAGTSDALCG